MSHTLIHAYTHYATQNTLKNIEHTFVHSYTHFKHTYFKRIYVH